ncbi:MAG: hypothetical protein SFV51_03880 [Bryobacteraceae bacterium]|nr:hypothetical protein [Bryobacteraceae bacterium]
MAPLCAADPPDSLLRRVLERETETQAVRANYAYRQSVVVEELETSGRKRGEYREIREVIFTPEGNRHEQMVKKPSNTLERLRMSDEDFQDIRDIQPFLFTRDQLHLYQTRFRGEETIAQYSCWVLEVKPRQILQGQRLFEGLVWVHQADFSVIQMEGRAVPQIYGRKEENLFPRFMTVRKLVDGNYWFPDRTVGDDILPFRTGPLRMRLKIEYSAYKRFAAESTIKFEPPK